MASACLHNVLPDATMAMPRSAPQIRLEPRPAAGSRLPCRCMESQFPQPRNWRHDGGDLSDSSPDCTFHENLLCQSLRSALESFRLANGVSRAASRVLGLVEARRSLAMSQAIDEEVLHAVHAELLRVRSSCSSAAPGVQLPVRPPCSSSDVCSVQESQRDDLFSDDPWEGCEDAAAEDLFDWFNESLQVCPRSAASSLRSCSPLVPQTWARLGPVPQEECEKLGSSRISLSSASTASIASGVDRLSTVSTSRLSTAMSLNGLERSSGASMGRLSISSTLSSTQANDMGMDLSEKSYHAHLRLDAVKRPCQSAGSLDSFESETSGMSWQQMWHQRLLNVRSALSARGERKETLGESRREPHERC